MEDDNLKTATASSLLTPDDASNKTTSVPLLATNALDKLAADSTPVTASSKFTISLPSTLMSPVSPVVTTASESKLSLDLQSKEGVVSVAVSESDSKEVTTINKIDQEEGASTEGNVSEKVNPVNLPVPSGNIKVVENNNEKLVQDEKEGTSKGHIELKSGTEQGMFSVLYFIYYNI